MAYLIDTNVLITAKNFHYGFDFCPAFWRWLVEQHALGRVLSVTRVRDEIRQGNDELSEWVAALPDEFFVAPAEESKVHLEAVSQWISTPGRYPAAQVNVFASAADFYLVGQARQASLTLVTYEAFQKQKGKIQIPEVCAGVGVECLPPHEMLRRERAKFVLGAGA
jgi:hypothetical protein